MKRRTGPTVTQSGQGQRQHLFRDANDSDDTAEDDMIVGPTQHVSQVRVGPRLCRTLIDHSLQAKGLFD